jgi:Skp family chaperone for outer membrane proteins
VLRLAPRRGVCYNSGSSVGESPAARHFAEGISMRRWGLACVLGVAVGAVSAAAADPPVGIVNLEKVVKNHKPFQDKLSPLKEQAKELEKTLQVRKAELEAVDAQYRKAAPGSPESQRLGALAGKLQGELQRFVSTEQANMQKKELGLYMGFYKQIDAEVSKIAKAKGLKLVLRDQDFSFDENQPVNDMAKTLGRNVLFQDGLDITDDVIKALGGSAGKAR